MDQRRRVAITGLGVVSPIGIGKDKFWESLAAGKSGVDRIRAFDASLYPCQIAGEVKGFVPTDFIAPRKTRTMARFSQFATAATRLALEDAQLQITTTLASQTAICYGTSVCGVGDVGEEAFAALQKQGYEGIHPWFALEYPPHAASSYIAIEFGITGPAVTISSNCCTGIDAIHAGYEQIAEGTVTTALVGASDAPIFPSPFAAFCALGAVSRRNDAPTRASRPYDLKRDGIVIAEGAATLVLEDLDAARDRGAHVYAEILGYGAAGEAIGMRKGDISGQVMAKAISEALNRADLTPSDIDHVNAHGSSLPDYDICDSNAFKVALGNHAYRTPISSIKSMIGQPVSAAGALQTAASCLSIAMQRVPPTINQELSDPRCDLDYVPNVSRAARVRHVLINGHSFGGSVSALVIGKVIS